MIELDNTMLLFIGSENYSGAKYLGPKDLYQVNSNLSRVLK